MSEYGVEEIWLRDDACASACPGLIPLERKTSSSAVPLMIFMEAIVSSTTLFYGNILVTTRLKLGF